MSSTPDNRPPEQIRREARARLQAGFIVTGAWQCCLNCQEWQDGTKDPKSAAQFPARCGRFGMQPPLDIVVVGCEHWLEPPPF